jgi:hypothetical protein
MFKYLSLLLLPLLSFGSISITPSVISDGYLYDLDVEFELNKFVETEDFFIIGDEGSKIYYESLTFKPSEDGWYTFDNYNSDLTVGTTVINETQLLIYDSTPNSVIIDEPTGFRLEGNSGWGLGIEQATFEHSDPPQEFYGEVQLTGGTEYIVVFSSFTPDAYGTLDVSILGNDPAVLSAVIPEPTSFALLMAFGTFLFVAIRQRNK